MPVFIIMFRTLHGLTYRPTGDEAPLAHAVYTAAGQPQSELGFLPRFISHESDLFRDLVGQTEMRSIGLDLARTAVTALGDSFGTGLIFGLKVLFVTAVGGYRSPSRAAGGAMIFGMAEALWAGYFPVEWRDGAMFAGLVALLILRPRDRDETELA